MDKVYTLPDLIDLTSIRNMADAHYRTTGMPMGIVDAVDGAVLVAAGWQEICVRFHRANRETNRRCLESDAYIKSRLVEGEVCSYKCRNGLWDMGIPIIVDGRHLATMFLGQFFYDDEVPERDFFMAQAVKYGFETEGYMAALDRVPVFSREKVDSILEYNRSMAAFIADLAGHALLKVRAEGARVQDACFLQNLLDAIPNPIFYKDTAGVYLGCNKAFESYIGLGRQDVVGKTVYELAPKELADRYREMDNDLFSAGGVQIYESSVRYADATLHDVVFNKATYTGPDGSLAGLVGIILDITDLKYAESERARLEMMLRQAQKMEAIGTLAGGIAHDFNNILTALIGYGSILQSRLAKDDPLKVYADNILSASEKAAALTQSLLAFSRSQLMDAKPQKINTIIRNMENLLQRLLSEDLELRVLLSEQDPAIVADMSQIDQVLLNLATNARDAMSNGGRLTIETCPVEMDSAFIKAHGYGAPGRYVLLSVSDTGTGMDEKTRQKIFEPFFTTKVVGKGIGLGLAIVYGIVKQHNGYINIYSEPGEGTSVHIYLPRVTAEVEEPVPPAMEIRGGSETVLVVEDSEDSRRLLKDVLDSKGYSVVEAVDGLDAVSRFNCFKDSIDLILMDVVMPRKNGVEAYNEIKQVSPHVKVLFMSGYTGDVVFEKGVHDRFNYVSKPISPNVLLMRVRELLDES